MVITQVEDVSEQLIGAFQNPGLLIGIPLALLGAVFMSFGAQYQHRGVTKVELLSGSAATQGLSRAQLLRLLTRPSWVIGTLMLGVAIIAQLFALSYAPLIVVQPLGAIALVITTLLNARISGHRPTKRSLRAIAECVGGILIFVTIAALVATDEPVADQQLLTILAMLGLCSVVFVGLWLVLRSRMRALFYIIGAGVMYGFVATLAKAVISRIQSGDFDLLTVVCLVALLVAGVMGAYSVQTAYSSGPPDLAIAGLTVIDPMVAIVIGLTVLGEAENAPSWAYVGFAFAGAVAVFGVIELARYHPQILSESQELAIKRGSAGGEIPKPSTGSVLITGVVARVWPEAESHDNVPSDSQHGMDAATRETGKGVISPEGGVSADKPKEPDPPVV